VSGASRQDLITLLDSNPRTCLVGEDIDTLGNLILPELKGQIVLAIAADCHVLHGRLVAEAITKPAR